MRALLVCPEFPLSFWSFQKSCRLRGNKTVNPPLGLITVAALLPTEWEMRLADLNTRSLTEEDWQWADLVLISAMFIQRAGLLALVREAKRRGKTVVAGGPYPTSLPEVADLLLQPARVEDPFPQPAIVAHQVPQPAIVSQ